MKRVFLILAALISITYLSAREFSIDAGSARKIEISNLSGKVTIIGVSGTAITISGDAVEPLFEPSAPDPTKAKGLKEITPSGDNTGMGINVERSGNTIRLVGSYPMRNGGDFIIKVPAGIDVQIDNPPFGEELLKIKGISGELIVSSIMGDIVMEAITGPLTLSSVNGDVNAIFSSLSQAGPTSLSVVNGDLDISLPVAAKAEFNLSALLGGIFSDFDIAEKKEKPAKAEGLKPLGEMKSVSGKINGGGVKINLSNISGSIYIRKK